MIVAIVTLYLSSFAVAGGVAANTGWFGATPRDDLLGRTALGVAPGLWFSISWPFYLLGF